MNKTARSKEPSRHNEIPCSINEYGQGLTAVGDVEWHSAPYINPNSNTYVFHEMIRVCIPFDGLSFIWDQFSYLWIRAEQAIFLNVCEVSEVVSVPDGCIGRIEAQFKSFLTRCISL
jgi:hypothetical protein